MPDTFSGLPADYFDFFNELKTNNNREWFGDNKARFRTSVQEPLALLVEAVAPRLRRISKHFNADPRLNGGSVFRIYKDMRFSKDKTPYKTHGAIQFRHMLGKSAHAPGFYVHLAPDEIVCGGGIWHPPSPQLLNIRTAIRENPKEWQNIIGNDVFTGRFDALRGDGITRPPRGFDENDPHIKDIMRKSFFAMQDCLPADTQKPGFADDLEGVFQDAAPLMKFLCKAVDAPF